MKQVTELFTPHELKAYRESLRLSQRDFGELLGVSAGAVKFWELGERQMPITTVKILRLFIKYPQLIAEF